MRINASSTVREAPDKRQYGYSRDKRGDCRQVVIGLIVTPEGFPLSYEVLAGNTADCTTLSDLLKRIETRYGKANRIWVMDCGIPTEETLGQMCEMGASYLVGTPKGRLSKLEQPFLGASWEYVREGLQVKRLSLESDTYVLAVSAQRIGKERGMRRRRLKRYVERLKQLQRQSLTRDPLLMKVGAAKQDAGRAASLIKLTLPSSHESVQVTLKHQLKRAATGLTPRAVLDKFKTMQMVDVHLPTTDGRHLGRFFDKIPCFFIFLSYE